MTAVCSLRAVESMMMEWLGELVACGARCPTNDQIAERLGFPRASSGSTLLRALERRRLIAVQRFQAGRIVTIVATGASTGAPKSVAPHWRLRPRCEQPAIAPPRRRYTRSPATEFLNQERYRGPAPEHQRVDRDPCPRCGVRADVGCACRRARLGMEMGL